jgi:hypothetical protein
MAPMAIVEAKSKLDIFEKVLSPETRVINIIIENIKSTEIITFNKIGPDA